MTASNTAENFGKIITIIEMSVGKRSLMMNLRMIATTSHMVDG